MEARIRTLGIALVCAGLLALCALHVEVGPTPAHAAMSTGGDSTLAAAGSFKIYPFFVPGGSHIASPQFVKDANSVPLNGYQQALGGWVASDLSSLRIIIFSTAAGVDTSGRTVKAGERYGITAPFDSIAVLNTGGTSTLVRHECVR